MTRHCHQCGEPHDGEFGMCDECFYLDDDDDGYDDDDDYDDDEFEPVDDDEFGNL